VGWLPFFAQEFDYYQMSFAPSPSGLGRQRDIPRPPSEYIYRQVYGAFIQDTVGCKLLPDYGSDTFMWSNDYLTVPASGRGNPVHRAGSGTPDAGGSRQSPVRECGPAVTTMASHRCLPTRRVK